MLTVGSLVEKHKFLFEEACQTAQIAVEDYKKYQQFALSDK